MTNLYEIGRICVKTMGREAGSYCVVIDQLEGSQVLITGPKNINGVRRRSCNIRHLEPIDATIQIEKGAEDEVVEKTLADAGLTEKFRSKIRLSS